MKQIYQRCTVSPKLLIVILLLVLQSSISAAQNSLYVDASKTAGASQNGTTWAKAYPTLAEAINTANSSTTITAIYIAQGTYYPTGNQSATERNTSFVLTRGGISIFGGYPSGGGVRNYLTNPTVLSGNINQINSATDNSYHVLVLAGVTTEGDILVEGINIVRGRADAGSNVNYNGQNIPRNSGGGLVIANNTVNVTIKNVVISANYAADAGAGIYIRANAPNIINTLISGNYANYGGGAVNLAGANTQYVNCTIAGNHDNNGGGGIRNSGSKPTITNSIIHGNNGGISNNSSTPVINYSLVQGLTGTTNGNLNGNTTSPGFFAAVSPNSAPIEGGGYNLIEKSAPVNRGSNESYTASGGYLSGDLDLAGNVRVHDLAYEGIIDMGAFEEIQISPDFNGVGAIRYVKEGATGNGTSWANASGDLQAIINKSTTYDQIWIAKGTYRPNRSAANPTVVTINQRDNAFVLKSGISVYGGFLGNESTLAQRNVSANPTILSGDFNHNDVVTTGANGVITYSQTTENAYHVLVAANATNTLLDGLTISGGNANGSGSILVDGQAVSRNEGGLLTGVKTTNLKVVNCILRSGFASDMGGAICLQSTEGFRISASLINQSSANHGGAIAFKNSSINQKQEIANCTLSGNNASKQGGGVFQKSGQLTVTNTVVSGNYAINSHAGGLYAYRPEDGADVKLTMINCQVTGNRAGGEGGGLRTAVYYHPDRQPSRDDVADAYIYNCTFSGNRAGAGGGIYRHSGYSRLFIRNCIVWGNSSGIEGGTSNNSVQNSISETRYNGTDNTINDPMFMDQKAFSTAPFTNGNYSLKLCSDAINTGNATNLNLPETDLTNSPRLNGVIDKGAFEYHGTNAGEIRYVRQGFTGNGSSWANASGDLQEMINISVCGDQVFVAKGTYLPNRKANAIQTKTENNRDNAFVLKSGVQVYGGFAGTESSLSQRNLSISANKSTLSGDFNNDDQVVVSSEGVITFTNNGENAYHVVVAVGLSDAFLDGFAISRGRANNTDYIMVNGIEVHRNNGSGIAALWSVNLTISNCTIENNHSSNSGGGIILGHCDDSRINSSVIQQNRAQSGGGLISLNTSNRETNYIKECLFILNNAVSQGGGIYGRSGKFIISNTTVSGNRAFDSHGGGIYVYRPEWGADVSITLTNCQITGNRTSGDGGGLRIAVDLNTDEENWNVKAEALIYNCTFAGNRAASGGAIHRHTRYAALTIANSIIWGNSSALGGAESSVKTSHSIIEGGYNGELNTSQDPLFANSPSFTTAPFKGGNYIPQACSPAINTAGETVPDMPSTDLAGNKRVHEILDRGAYEFQSTTNYTGIIRYVKAGASGNGASWGNASGDLQSMINASACGDVIYVARGIYKPNRKASAITTISPTNDRDNTFLLKSQVKIYGGFIGTEASSSDRVLTNMDNASILSGDFNGTDGVARSAQGVLTYTDNGENAYHVATASNITGAVLDGFVMNGGRANSNSSLAVNGVNISRYKGAGLIIQSSTITVSNCTFQNSHASSNGGGLYAEQSTVVVTSPVFRRNKADYGAGLALESGFLTINQGELTQNDAVEQGGGIYLVNVKMNTAGSRFTENRAKEGGGLFNHSESASILEKCYVQGNRASAGGGGGIYNTSSSHIDVINSLISGNRSSNPGAGIRNNNTAKIINCTIAGNHSDEGAGGIQLDNGNTQTVRNCIISGNSSGVAGGGFYATSIIQSGASGLSIYTEDPGFANAPSSNSAPFTAGDYLAQNCWPVINTGNTTDIANLLPSTDLAGNPRIAGQNIDLGIYESANSTSKKIFVKAGATGNGSSWVTSLGNLQDAINGACAGDSIFVANGTFKPIRKPTSPNLNSANPKDRDNAFTLRNHVAIFGGFNGTEAKFADRVLSASQPSGTILSGDFDGNDAVTGTGSTLSITGNTENAYHVVMAVGVTNVVLDGILITGGNASSDSEVTIKNNSIGRRNGGGILIEAAGDVVISNVTIRHNFASAIGGGVAIHYSDDIKIEGSNITYNRSNDGSGIRIRASSGQINKTTIQFNTASADGGGIYISEKESNFTLNESKIISNYASADGGGVRISASTLRLSGGGIDNNRAQNGSGGAMFSRNNAHVYLNDATVNNNYCKDNGGGIWNGGIGETASQVYLTKVQMKGNQSIGNGGALYNFNGSGAETAVLDYVEISGNRAHSGGAIYNTSGNSESSVTTNHIFNSVISRNVASQDGGGIYNVNSNVALLVNVTIANNEAKYGGGIYNNSSKCPPIPNTDYYECFDDKSTSYVRNTIIWGNTALRGSGIYEGSGSYQSEKLNSLVQGIANTEKGNLDANTNIPLFVDAANGDYTLQPGSPGINAGDNALLSLSKSLDFAGNPRFSELIVDMGALEYQPNSNLHPIRYVREGGTGNGTNWDNASGNLQAMINAADVRQVWVAAGTYYSSGDGFNLKNNVSVYGGFINSGTPTLGSRNPKENPTTLSGSNERRVINNNFTLANPLTNTAVLDGFVLTAGKSSAHGGAIFNNYASPKLTNLTIFGNKATNNGGAIYNFSSTPEITYCKFFDNIATGNGGAIYNTSTSTPLILNCLFTGNSAVLGGAIFANAGSSYQLVNGTLSKNTASTSGGATYHSDNNTLPTFYNNIIYDNGTQILNVNAAVTNVTYSLIQGGYSGNGNINTNPQFFDPANSDYSLKSNSPAIDAGDTTAYINLGRDFMADRDLDGNLRTYNESIDMGAYEFYGTPNLTTRYVKASGTGDGTSWGTASGNLQAMINEAGVVQVWVAAGTYISSADGFKLKNKVAIYGGFPSSGEPKMDVRDWKANPTILSGDNQRRVFNNTFTPSSPLDGTAVLDGFIISNGNSSSNGGAMYNANASPTLRNLTFSGNQSSGNGGAIYNAASAPLFSNCQFTNNTATGNGGAMCHASNSSPILVNCLFVSNGAGSGGAIYANNGSSYKLINSTVVKSSAGGGLYHANSGTRPLIQNSILYGNGASVTSASSAVTTVSYSLVQGGHSGMGNMDASPEFTNYDGGDYRINASSPAINQGNTSLFSAIVEDIEQSFDIAGNPRVFDISEGGSIDMGVYEFQGAPVYPAIRFVKAGGTGSGYSWSSASGNLQSMIDAPDVQQVWVAKGTYKPERIAGGTTDERDKAFQLRSNVKVYGGFLGTESALDNRSTDFTLHKSVLSGDLYGDDNNGIVTGINAYHVVVSAGDVGEAELNGFTISGGHTGGNTSGNIMLESLPVSRERGGGISVVNSSPRISNVIISGNMGWAGGGFAASNASKPTLLNVVISGNTGEYGGAVYNNASSPVFSNVTITKNSANETNDQGVAFRNVSESYPIVYNSIIFGNKSANGNISNIFNSGGNNPTSAPEFAYSLVEGSGSDWTYFGIDAGNNLDADPKFADIAGGNYRLLANSPAINGGNDTFFTSLNTETSRVFDIAGNQRIQNESIDMGAFEVPCPNGLSETVASAHRQLVDGTNRIMQGCYYLATLIPGGSKPVQGFITATSRLASDAHIVYGEARFVRRYYSLIAETADATASATLYFTKEDFQAYNDSFGSKAGVMLPVNPQDAIGNLKIVQYHGTGGEGGLPGTYNEGQTILTPASVLWNNDKQLWEVSFALNGFSGFFITGQSSGALPVVLHDFKARKQEQTAHLQWNVTNAVNFSHFEVERSVNTKHFSNIGGVRFDSQRYQYSFYDTPESSVEVLYYRIKMVDLDDSFSYSRIESVNFGKRDEALKAYPNPFSGRLTIESATKQKAKLIDVKGRVIGEWLLNEGKNEIKTSPLTIGIYLLKSTNDETIRLIKE